MSTRSNEYRVVTQDGCRIVYGMIPLGDMANLMKSMQPKAVMDTELSAAMGATLVMGLPEDLKKLRASRPPRPVQGSVVAQIGEGAAAWMQSGKVGMSSNHLLFTLTGFNAQAWLRSENTSEAPEVEHPHDPADLRRCRFLLEAEPKLKERLSEVAATHPVWAALVSRWDELCTLMDEESPDWREESPRTKASQTYTLMRAIIDDARPARRGSPRP